MADLVFIALGLGFLALCALYVRGLDHIVQASRDGEWSPDDTTAPADLALASR